MYGLKAISAANGWAIAIFGVIIVMSGLWVLSFVISQFPKALSLIETHSEKRKHRKDLLKQAAVGGKPQPASPMHDLSDLEQTADLYHPVVAKLGESFELKQLYVASQEHNFLHPHLTIRAFREAGILVHQGDGVYFWNR